MMFAVTMLISMTPLAVLFRDDEANWVKASHAKDRYREIAEREMGRHSYLAALQAEQQHQHGSDDGPMPYAKVQLFRKRQMVLAFPAADALAVRKKWGVKLGAQGDVVVVGDAFTGKQDFGTPITELHGRNEKGYDMITMDAESFMQQYTHSALHHTQMHTKEGNGLNRKLKQLAQVQYVKKAVAAVRMPCAFHNLVLPHLDKHGKEVKRRKKMSMIAWTTMALMTF